MENKCLIEDVVKLYFDGYGVKDALKIAKERNEHRECLQGDLDYTISIKSATECTSCNEPKLLAMCRCLNGLEDIGGLNYGENRKAEIK
ncbi:hypothetical protein [Clostridium sp. BSD9I1]|uniref:hypothetical protein n=1 Tax=Clostridium sp. BSD9I1 TaxID=2003589 RepID=UPI0016474162|nr:hypothetical protein [Clostridium sp. BSD9I1]